MPAASLRYIQRLPVIFMLDTSKEMQGTLEVTMQDGLIRFKDELFRQRVAPQFVYLSSITFGAQVRYYRLKPFTYFNPPTWQAQGPCELGPGFVELTNMLQYDLIVRRPEHPGDYRPLVFLVLGSHPSDQWQNALQSLATYRDNRSPWIITLVTRPDLVQKMRAISMAVFQLKPVEAIGMTNFFIWTAQVAATLFDDCQNGRPLSGFPPLPHGVIRVA